MLKYDVVTDEENPLHGGMGDLFFNLIKWYKKYVTEPKNSYLSQPEPVGPETQNEGKLILYMCNYETVYKFTSNMNLSFI